VFEALENTGLAAWVRESPSIFSYTLVLSLHAIGLAVVIGVSALIALRMLGVAPGIPLPGLRQLYPVLWFGFMVNTVSGGLLFIANATGMGAMPVFWVKMTAVLAGMVVGWRIRWCYLSGVDAAAGTVSPAGRRMAYLSLLCWFVALLAGRMTGYPTLITTLF
jgi:hypothetical protein